MKELQKRAKMKFKNQMMETYTKELEKSLENEITLARKLLAEYSQKEFGASLKRVRLALDLSLDDVIRLAQGKLGCSRSSLSAIENGKQEIGIRTYIFLKALYNI